MGQDERHVLGGPRIGRAAAESASAEELADDIGIGCRVLIVDHDENVLIALTRLLGEAKYNITTAQDGVKALKLLWQGAFDLLLLDDVDANGEEVVRQARRVGNGTPVVVMQRVPPSDDLAVRYARLGACFFINRRDAEAIAELVQEYFSQPRFLCAHLLETESGNSHSLPPE